MIDDRKMKLLQTGDEFGLAHPVRIASLILLSACISSFHTAAYADLPYGFGTKVGLYDFDAGNPLDNLCNYSLGYRNLGEEVDRYDIHDPVYLDMDNDRTTSINDIRLTTFSIFPPGSKVSRTDLDIDSHLIRLKGWCFVFCDKEEDGIYDLDDPVYLHNSNLGNKITEGDIRLTTIPNFSAGSKVWRSDGDEGQQVFVLMAIMSPINTTHIADIRFFNANGNYRAGNSGNNGLSSSIYDRPDQVYLDISFPIKNIEESRPMGLADINDLRLSI